MIKIDRSELILILALYSNKQAFYTYMMIKDNLHDCINKLALLGKFCKIKE